ncbi:MAG: hypothetical protein ACRC20_13465 [Segniliparus sp.]|uniref:hypothetical protein n=1 Tax=Segniliparus sp. TaxID=2804064 RepID=UPI003F2B6FEF
MAVRWELVLQIGGALLLAVVLAAALLPPRRAASAALRPLAHVERLTELPEYVSAVRIQRALLVATALAVLALLGCALHAAARPISAERASGPDRDHPDDVMLCVGLPATSPAAGAFLSYYQTQSAGFVDQRIGLTSLTLRAIPLTADHAFVNGRLRGFASLAKLSAEAAAGRQLTEQETKSFADLQDAFSRGVRYTDYRANFIDALASCVLGFPDHASPSGRRRSVVYLGPTNESPGPGARTAYSSGALAQLVQEAKAQINVIDVEPGADPDNQPHGVAQTETEVSGGKFFAFAESASPSALAGALDQIRANLPDLPAGAEPVAQEREADDPSLVLGLAVGFAILLSLCLAVVRR